MKAEELKKMKTLLRRYGHRYFKEAHNKQDYDSIDEEFIPQIAELYAQSQLPKGRKPPVDALDSYYLKDGKWHCVECHKPMTELPKEGEEVSDKSRELLLKCLKQLEEVTEPETELATIYNNFARVISTIHTRPTEEEIDKTIERIVDMHPYKESGNRDSYSEYNEGWADACDILGQAIKELNR